MIIQLEIPDDQLPNLVAAAVLLWYVAAAAVVRFSNRGGGGLDGGESFLLWLFSPVGFPFVAAITTCIWFSTYVLGGKE